MKMISFEQFADAVCEVTGRGENTTVTNLTTWLTLHGVEGTDYVLSREFKKKVYLVTRLIMANWVNVAHISHKQKIELHTHLQGFDATTMDEETVRVFTVRKRQIPAELAARVRQTQQEARLMAVVADPAPVAQPEAPKAALPVKSALDVNININVHISGGIEVTGLSQGGNPQIEEAIIAKVMKAIDPPSIAEAAQVFLNRNTLETLADPDSDLHKSVRRVALTRN